MRKFFDSRRELVNSGPGSGGGGVGSGFCHAGGNFIGRGFTVGRHQVTVEEIIAEGEKEMHTHTPDVCLSSSAFITMHVIEEGVCDVCLACANQQHKSLTCLYTLILPMLSLLPTLLEKETQIRGLKLSLCCLCQFPVCRYMIHKAWLSVIEWDWDIPGTGQLFFEQVFDRFNQKEWNVRVETVDHVIILGFQSQSQLATFNLILRLWCTGTKWIMLE